MTGFLLDLWLEIAVSDSGRKHGRVHERGVRHTLESNDWEFLSLRINDVLGLMPVRLGTPGDSEETILLSNKGQSWWDAGLELSLTVIGEGSGVSQQNASHQDLTFDVGP